MSATLLELPAKDIGDVPRGLRALADGIERGEYDDAHFLAWVLDCGNGRVELGGLGHSAQAGPEAHLLFAVAQRKLEKPSV